MADSDKPASDVQVSAQRRRTAQARQDREARLAANLRANIARRKQQVRNRAAGEPAEDDDPAA
jgi:hypothetical protein